MVVMVIILLVRGGRRLVRCDVCNEVGEGGVLEIDLVGRLVMSVVFSFLNEMSCF